MKERISHKNPTHQLNKREVIKDQIEAAIKLFATYEHHVAVHSLASASKQILKDISKKNDGDFSFNLEVWAKPEHIKEYRAHMNAAANFFKHADKDSDEEFDFNEECNDLLLLTCIMGFREVVETPTPIMCAFIGWFTALKPEFLKDGTFKSFVMSQRQASGGIEFMHREDQVKALRSILTI